jgi:hypothetical protein
VELRDPGEFVDPMPSGHKLQDLSFFCARSGRLHIVNIHGVSIALELLLRLSEYMKPTTSAVAGCSLEGVPFQNRLRTRTRGCSGGTNHNSSPLSSSYSIAHRAPSDSASSPIVLCPFAITYCPSPFAQFSFPIAHDSFPNVLHTPFSHSRPLLITLHPPDRSAPSSVYPAQRSVVLSSSRG